MLCGQDGRSFGSFPFAYLADSVHSLNLTEKEGRPLPSACKRLTKYLQPVAKPLSSLPVCRATAPVATRQDAPPTWQPERSPYNFGVAPPF